MDAIIFWILLNTKPDLSYKTDIKPIFTQRCYQCHYSGPLNWMQYENAFKYKDRIRYMVWDSRTMPPYGRITEQEREMIRDWVDQGAKE